MQKIITYFNYNWFSIINKNKKNNEIIELKQKEKKEISKLVFKKLICALIFIMINFLLTYFGSIEIYKLNYQNNILMHFIKDNFLTSVLWLLFLIILPFLTLIMLGKKRKSKYYLPLVISYLISNLFNIIMITYFITSFHNGIILGILGILNIIITIILNCNIIIKLNENCLKK